VDWVGRGMAERLGLRSARLHRLVIVWFWKIRPHFRQQREHHHILVARLYELHTKVNYLHAKLDDRTDKAYE
jgi:hypothetical protein